MPDDVSIRVRLQEQARTSAGLKKIARDVDDVGDAADRSSKHVGGLSKDFDVLGSVMGLVRPAALIAGFGLAASAASAAGASAVALGAGLAPVAGIAASAGAGLLAYQTSLGLVKASMGGVESSFKGTFAAFEKATPVTNRLAQVVGGMTPQLLHLRNVAQGRILGGVIDGVRSAEPLIGKLTPALARTSTVLGGLARDAGGLASELGTEFARILNTNVAVINNLGGAGLDMAIVFTRLLDAARPLTLWLSKLAAGWAHNLALSSSTADGQARLAGFFEKTRTVLGHVFSIAGSVGRTIWNIAKAGSALGGDLVGSLDKAAKSMAAWSGSAGGQAGIAGFFARARQPIYEVAKLVRDVAKAFGRLSGGSNLGPLIAQVRTQLLPVLERVVAGTTAAFGPALVNLVTQLARAFEPLAGSSGPLVMFVDIMAGLAEASATIVGTVPGASTALSALFGVMAINKALIGVSMVTGFGTFVKTLATLTPTAMAAAKAEGTMSAAQIVLNAVMAANPIVLVIAGLVALGAALVIAYQKVGWFHDAVDAVWNFLKTNWATIAMVLAGPIGIAVGLIAKHWDTIKQGVSDMVSAVANRFRDLIAFIQRIPGAISGALGSIGGGILDKALSVGKTLVPGIATGGTIQKSGWAVVGERGPELRYHGAGDTIFDAGQTAAALGSNIRTPSLAGAAAGAPGAASGPRTIYLLLDPRGNEVIGRGQERYQDGRAARR